MSASSLGIDHALISSLKRECFCLWPQLSPLPTVANKHFMEERAAFLQLLLDQFSLLTPPLTHARVWEFPLGLPWLLSLPSHLSCAILNVGDL